MICVPNFSSLNWFSFSSTVFRCWQLLTADDSCYEKKFNWNFHVHTKVYTNTKFQLSRLIFIFITYYQLISAVDSCWGLIEKKVSWNFHVHSIGDIFAKFQLPRLIFIFISFWQLLSAVDSWWQLSRKKFNWNFHLPPQCTIHAKFELSMLLGSRARECDAGRTPPDGRQVKIELTQASLHWC